MHTAFITAAPTFTRFTTRPSHDHRLRAPPHVHLRYANRRHAPAPARMGATPPPAPTSSALISPPPGAFQAAADLGATKAANSTAAILVLGFAAGAYLALGGLLALSVGGSSPALAAANPGLHKFVFSAIGLPVGLTLVVATGAELFLGNCMLLTAAALSGRVGWARVVMHWMLAWVANFVGALGTLAMLLAAKGVTPAAGAAAASLTIAKCSLPFGVMLMRGVLCNWLVCLGVYVANASRDFAGKLLAVFIAVSTFISLGFDNCVANMFFLPLGIHYGADISWKKAFLANLLPVTLGNLLGGALLVGMLYFVAFGRKKASPNATPAPTPTPTGSGLSAERKGKLA